MIIHTSEGTFGSFRDIRKHMSIEHLSAIRIESVDYWGIPVLSKGTYTPEDIDHILEDD